MLLSREDVISLLGVIRIMVRIRDAAGLVTAFEVALPASLRYAI